MVLHFLETKGHLVELVHQRQRRDAFEGDVDVEDPLDDD